MKRHKEMKTQQVIKMKAPFLILLLRKEFTGGLHTQEKNLTTVTVGCLLKLI